MIADTVADGLGDLDILPNPSNPTFFDNSLGVVHRGGPNVLFGDGHVQWYLKKDLAVPSPPVAEDAPKQRLWNIDNEPSRPWP